MSITRLCDAYGMLLTDHRRELIRSYYDDDLSLAEIAENLGITRQAALCSIKQAEKQLVDYEAKLHIVQNYDMLNSQIQETIGLLESDAEMARQKLQSIVSDIL